MFHSPPSARGGVFVCSSPKCSLGSRQIKSQLADLGGGVGCAGWQAALPGRQRSSILAGEAGGRCETRCSHTAPPEHRCYPGGFPSPDWDTTSAPRLDLTREHLRGCSQNSLCPILGLLGAFISHAAQGRCCSNCQSQQVL